MKVRIYGASDDLVEVEGCPNADERGAYNRTVSVAIGGDKGIVVSNRHDGKLGWVTSLHLGPRFEDEDPMPFPVSVEMSHTGYSLAVIVECPDGTLVEYLDTDEDDE